MTRSTTGNGPLSSAVDVLHSFAVRFALVFIFLLALPFLLPANVQVLNEILLLGVFAMSYDFVFGYSGILTFGHAAFFGVGSYVMVLFLKFEVGLPFLGLVVAVVIVSGVFGFVFGWISLRVSGLYFAMVTLAFAQLLWTVPNRFQVLGGQGGIPVVTRPSTVLPIQLGEDYVFFAVSVILLMGSFLIMRRILGSPLGETLKAIRENEERVRMVGYDTFRYKLVAFVVSGVLAAVAGGFYSLLFYFTSPSNLYWTTTGDVLISVLIGGIGTLVGPVLGVTFVHLIEEVFSPLTGQWRIIVGLSILLVVLFFPKGIVGTLSEYFER